MTIQIPAFYFLHAAADAGAANLSSDAEDSDYPLENLIDYRPSTLFKFSSSGAHWVKVDRGTQPMSEGVNRLIIPAGHNLENAAYCYLQSSINDSDWTLQEFWNQSTVTDPDGLIDRSFGSITDRWLRFGTTTTGYTWEFGQLYLTRTRQGTQAGPEPEYTDQPLAVSIVRDMPGRSANSLLGPARRYYKFKIQRVPSADIDVYDDLFASNSDAVPFYFQPPDDTENPRFVLILPGSFNRQQDHPILMNADAPTYTISFDLIEQIT
jgi:hypothetical protein